MKQFLQKVFELLRGLLGRSLAIAIRVIALLRSVQIDAARAVILCVALQVALVVLMVLALQNPAGAPATPSVGTPEPAGPELAAPVQTSENP